MDGGEGACGCGETWGHVNEVATVLLIKFKSVQLQWAVCQLIRNVELAENLHQLVKGDDEDYKVLCYSM